MTDAEIMKALECCIFGECENCPHDEETACKENLNQEILDLINCQKAEIKRLSTLAELGNMRANDYRTMRDRALKAKEEVERLEYVLLGVMQSVDKWLDDKELEQDEVNRAATMREKTLRIVETAKDEAIKEFAERVKEKFSGVSLCNNGFVNSTLDNLLKEMVGDTE